MTLTGTARAKTTMPIIAKIRPSGKVSWYKETKFVRPSLKGKCSEEVSEILRWNTCIMRWHGLDALEQYHLPLPEGAAPRLVNTAKFQQAKRRKGSDHLSSNGRQRLRDGAAILEHKYPGAGWFAFDTLTFPTEFDNQHNQVRLAHAINVFFTSLRRLYKDRGHECRYQYVIELHPSRGSSSGLPIPHIHVLRMGAYKRFQWIVHYSEIAEIWRSSVESSYAVPDLGVDWSAATRTEAVKKSVAAYMAKYLTKGKALGSENGDRTSALVLSQWWGQSRWLCRQIKLHTYHLKNEEAIRLLRFLGRREDGFIRWELSLSEGAAAISGTFTPKCRRFVRMVLSVAGGLLIECGKKVPSLFRGSLSDEVSYA